MRSTRWRTTPILSATLAPPRTTTKGRAGLAEKRREILDLSPHERADRSNGDERHHADGRSVGSMGRAERVVHVDVGERGELAREALFVRLLAGVKAQVLEQQHLARSERPALRERSLADAVLGEENVQVQDLAEVLGDGTKRQRRNAFSLRTAEMRSDDRMTAVGDHPLDRRQCFVDPRGVGDLAVANRDVQVGADEDTLAGERDFFEPAQRHAERPSGERRRSARRRPACDSRSPTRCRTTRRP